MTLINSSRGRGVVFLKHSKHSKRTLRIHLIAFIPPETPENRPVRIIDGCRRQEHVFVARNTFCKTTFNDSQENYSFEPPSSANVDSVDVKCLQSGVIMRWDTLSRTPRPSGALGGRRRQQWTGNRDWEPHASKLITLNSRSLRLIFPVHVSPIWQLAKVEARRRGEVLRGTFHPVN